MLYVFMEFSVPAESVTRDVIPFTKSSEDGVIFNVGGSVKLNGCTVTGNSASQGGGGIFNSSGTVTLNSCTITSNIAGYGGGGVYNDDMLKISGNVNVTGNTGETNGGSGSANNIYLED